VTGYQIIRAGSGYSVVLVVSPPNAVNGQKGATYYEFNPGRPVAGWNSNGFNLVSWEKDARYLFSGMADGMGFEAFPAEPFPTLDAVLTFIQEKRGR
jgi:hypothetical protein